METILIKQKLTAHTQQLAGEYIIFKRKTFTHLKQKNKKKLLIINIKRSVLGKHKLNKKKLFDSRLR